jgi:hypothetical protein
MQFLLLLPELPHAHRGGFLSGRGNAGRSSTIRQGRSFVLSAAEVVGCRLGVARRLLRLIRQGLPRCDRGA